MVSFFAFGNASAIFGHVPRLRQLIAPQESNTERMAYTWGMANQQSLSPFQEVHKKIQEARERARKERERDDALRKNRSENEAKREGFDRA